MLTFGEDSVTDIRERINPRSGFQNRNDPFSARTNELYEQDQVLHPPLPPSGPNRGTERRINSFSNANSTASFPSISNISTNSRGSPLNRAYGTGNSIVGSGRSSSPSGIQSYPSASMFLMDREGEDDDSYGIL